MIARPMLIFTVDWRTLKRSDDNDDGGEQSGEPKWRSQEIEMIESGKALSGKVNLFPVDDDDTHSRVDDRNQMLGSAVFSSA